MDPKCNLNRLGDGPAFERVRSLDDDERAALHVLRRALWALSAKIRAARDGEPRLAWWKAQAASLDWALIQIDPPETIADRIRTVEVGR